MNNMTRFLSKREKEGSHHRRDKSRDKSSDKKSSSFNVSSISAAFSKPHGKSTPHLQTSYSTIHTTSADSRPGVFLQTRPSSSDGFIAGLFKSEPQKKPDKDMGHQINAIKLRLNHHGYTGIEDGQIDYALNSKHANGDLDKAFELLLLFQESVEGIIKPYNPAVHMRGAENRQAVTCYLDSLLFAMFARLGSFEPILYTTFDDEPRRRLSTLIRLWVNMLRTGMLIQTDVTQFLQEALAACGWEDAGKCEQQDTSEAFSFITETLKLPLLTLKMDIYHTGAEDDKDDHKFIHERLLEVAVPDEVPGNGTIKLEDCLENYFNNRVEVRRHLARSNTLSSIRSGYDSPSEKESSQHIEITELSWSTPNTPVSSSVPNTPITPGGRLRATSIIRHRLVEEDGKDDGFDAASHGPSIRKGSVRKEVLMPAWQFFNLIPWYTKTQPSVTDADIASHFAQTRPVLGICLKRYGMREDCTPFRKNTFIDIPLDIRLPHFIQDDEVSEDGPLMGNFKLSLQSVICHRGNSVNAGHYISFIRGTSQISDGDFESDRQLSNTSNPPHYSPDRWIRFDDLHEPRVGYVDIGRALKDEMPYLLFYQVQPTIDGSPPPGLEPEPPSYADSAIGMKFTQSSPTLDGRSPNTHPGYFDGSSTPAIRLSTEFERHSEPRRSITLFDGERRGSVAFTETSLASTASSVAVLSAPVTPNEETTAQRMSRAAQRFTKSGSKSRPTSSSGENRISATFSRTLNMMKSKDQLNKIEPAKELGVTVDGAGDSQVSVPIEETSLKRAEGTIGRSKSKKEKRRNKSKGPSDKNENEYHHYHSHKGKGKEKDKDFPDRECIVM